MINNRMSKRMDTLEAKPAIGKPGPNVPDLVTVGGSVVQVYLNLSL
jgi:hypothetical protein